MEASDADESGIGMSAVPPTPSAGMPGTPRSQLGSARRRSSPGGSGRRSGALSDGFQFSTGGGYSDVDAGRSGAMSYGASSSGGRYSTVDDVVIWGTDINAQEARLAFSTFLQNFTTTVDVEDTYPHYHRRLQEIQKTQNYNLNIDCSHLGQFSRDSKALYDQLIKYPAETVEIIDMCVYEEFQLILDNVEQETGEDVSAQREVNINVRLFNLKELSKMRDLDPTDISTMVAIKGMVTRTSDVIPSMSVAFFRCQKCGESVKVANDRGRIEEPTSCTKCSAKFQMELVHNRCEYMDKQLVKLQETPENIPEGETPHTVNLFAFEDLVDIAKPGDRVTVTGIFRAVPTRPNPRMRTFRSVYRTYVDVIHFRKSEDERLSVEDARAEKGSEYHTEFEEGNSVQSQGQRRDERLEKMSRDPNIYEKLTASLAPSIWELDDVKKGVLAMLFGGTNKDIKGGGHQRGEINVLLCGDPGTAKSQLLGFVHKIAPRGIYTSGKGSSAVGLTAYVTKDPGTGGMVLESGALVLSDRGVCCIDEFDKMSDSTRAVLHEAMEQQTISIAKAGIICSLNARTSILASANPVESRWNPNRSVVANLQLPPTLLSRFDLLYLMLDKADPSADRRLARHLVSLYYPLEDLRATHKPPPYDLTDVTAYISYAKQNVQPRLSDESIVELQEGWLAMRRLGSVGAKKIVTATARQLESLIRISEALARLKFADLVTAEDAKEAVRLMAVATQQAATDPRTGRIDMDMIATGRSAASRENLATLTSAVADLLSTWTSRGGSTTFHVRQLAQALQDQSSVEVSREDLMEAVRSLGESENGPIAFNSKTNKIRLK